MPSHHDLLGDMFISNDTSKRPGVVHTNRPKTIHERLKDINNRVIVGVATKEDVPSAQVRPRPIYEEEEEEEDEEEEDEAEIDEVKEVEEDDEDSDNSDDDEEEEEEEEEDQETVEEGKESDSEGYDDDNLKTCVYQILDTVVELKKTIVEQRQDINRLVEEVLSLRADSESIADLLKTVLSEKQAGRRKKSASSTDNNTTSKDTAPRFRFVKKTNA